jgi:hypothetical protein
LVDVAAIALDDAAAYGDVGRIKISWLMKVPPT